MFYKGDIVTGLQIRTRGPKKGKAKAYLGDIVEVDRESGVVFMRTKVGVVASKFKYTHLIKRPFNFKTQILEAVDRCKNVS